MTTFQNIQFFTLNVLTSVERRQLIFAQIMSTVAALLEALVILIFYKFIAYHAHTEVNTPTDVFETYVASMELEIAISLLFVLILFSSIIAVITIYYIAYVGNYASVSLSEKILKSYLNRSYAHFSEVENVKKIKLITAEVDRLGLGVIMPTIIIFSKIMLALSLIVVLGYINILYTLSVVSIVLFCYLGFYLSLKNVLNRNSFLLSSIIEARFLALEKIFYGFEYLAIRKRYRALELYFQNINMKLTYLRSINNTISQSPKYIMDFVFFASVLAILLVGENENLTSTDEVFDLVAFTLAAMKMIPAVQAIFAQFATVKANFQTLIEVNETLQKDIHTDFGISAVSLSQNLPKDVLVRVEHLSISFAGNRVGLLDASFDINDKTFTVIRGSSGSGKSSFCRVLLDLEKAQSGKIFANSNLLNNKSPKFSYVPQVIYIFNGSLRENLCFGKEEFIKDDDLLTALKNADLAEFFSSLPSGFDTILGDGGASISGGQRQRLGIARAFLENPDMLILDEPTSALDKDSENNILQTLYKLTSQCTVIMITHADTFQAYSQHVIDFDRLSD